MIEAEELIGQTIAEKYVVDRVIGRGGMGTVLRAHHEELRTPAAIKVLLPDVVDNAAAVRRFLREARAAAQIRSDHVAHVYDVGKLPTGEPFMVMEYLKGCDLAEELTHRSELPIAEAVDILLQTMEAIAHAHSIGIIHRDLKPANLFLATQRDGGRLVKVLDFGISKICEDGDPAITESAAVLGSPLYMAPEQIRNASTVDERADIWSLGVILYECLAGTLPFSGVTSSAVLATIVADDHVPLELRCSDIPLELSETVEYCLAKDPDERIGSVAELSARLAVFATADARRYPAKIASILGLTPNHWSPLGPGGGRVSPSPAIRHQKLPSRAAIEPPRLIHTLTGGSPEITVRGDAPTEPNDGQATTPQLQGHNERPPGETTAISPQFSTPNSDRLPFTKGARLAIFLPLALVCGFLLLVALRPRATKNPDSRALRQPARPEAPSRNAGATELSASTPQPRFANDKQDNSQSSSKAPAPIIPSKPSPEVHTPEVGSRPAGMEKVPRSVQPGQRMTPSTSNAAGKNGSSNEPRTTEEPRSGSNSPPSVPPAPLPSSPKAPDPLEGRH